MTEPISLPLITVIIPTYNRSLTIERAIDSVLAQTYPHFEIVIVDDGSTDDTHSIISKYSDPRIRLIRHEQNRGVTAAKNTGLDNARGEWVTHVDSDDEITRDCLELLIAPSLKLDSTINHVNCNLIEYSTGKLTGKGVEHDQYIDQEMVMTRLSGAFWGIIKTELYGSDRFNEKVPGMEGVLGYRIRERSKIYYLHQGLYIYHTEGDDRVCLKKYPPEIKQEKYKYLFEDKLCFMGLKKYKPEIFYKECVKAILFLGLSKEHRNATFWYYTLLPKGEKNIIRSACFLYFHLPAFLKRFIFCIASSVYQWFRETRQHS